MFPFCFAAIAAIATSTVPWEETSKPWTFLPERAWIGGIS